MSSRPTISTSFSTCDLPVLPLVLWMTMQPGEFAYHCAFHPHMKGVIIVVA